MAGQPTKNPEPKKTETASFGDVAIRLGFITESQLNEAMKVQATAAKAGLRKRLGEILIKKGYLTPEQFEKVLKSQTANRKRIGDYELLSKLGEGGMGSVFKARQVFMDRVIALKILSPKMAKNKNFRDRFVREARAVAKLNHPHIVAGIDVGSKDGYCYFAMEYVDGETLGQHMQRKGGKLDEASALEYTRQLALALHHAHQNNLLHRDVKPDNALLDKERNLVKLADLGLARSAESEEDDAALTQAGQAVGTPFYISPEQARGLSDLTPATDLYSLGATLFHLVTGQVPFDGATAAVIMTRHLTDQAPSVCKLNPAVSSATEKIIVRCMQKKPEDRYRNAMDIVGDIERIQESKDDKRERTKTNRHTPQSASASERDNRQEREQRAERERERDRERGERETESAGAVTSVSGTRSFRRRRTQTDFVGLGIALAVVVVGIVLLIAMTRGKDASKDLPRKDSKSAAQNSPAPVTPVPAPIILPTRTPLRIERSADGTVYYKSTFESDVSAFHADLNIIRPGESIQRIKDKTGSNSTLKLARCRDEGAAMVRVFLPETLTFSRAAMVKFKVTFTDFTGDNPSLTFVYSTPSPADNQRIERKWTYVKPEFASSWVELPINIGGDAPYMQPAKLTEKLPYLAIYAGQPDQTFDAFIDDFEIVDSALPAGRAKDPAPGTNPERAPRREEAPARPAPREPREPAKEPKVDDPASAINRAL
jgi:eukaryotic-like serine/threonine-protein kinase